MQYKKYMFKLEAVKGGMFVIAPANSLQSFLNSADTKKVMDKHIHRGDILIISKLRGATRKGYRY